MLKQLSFCRGSGRGPCPRRDRGGLRRFFVLVPGHQLGGPGPRRQLRLSELTYSQGLTGDGHWEGVRALDYVTLPEDYAAIPLKQADIEPSEEEIQTQWDNLLESNRIQQPVTAGPPRTATSPTSTTAARWTGWSLPAAPPRAMT